MGASLTCFCLPLVCTYGRAPFFPPTLAYSWYGFALVGISIGYGCSRFRVVNGLEWRMRIQHAYTYGIQKQNIRLENQTVIEKEIWKVHKAEGEKGSGYLSTLATIHETPGSKAPSPQTTLKEHRAATVGLRPCPTCHLGAPPRASAPATW